MVEGRHFRPPASTGENAPGPCEIPGPEPMSKIDNRGQGKGEVVAGTITWEQLRELAGFRAEQGCAVSLYVNLDPREAPRPKHVQARVNSLLSEAERMC